MTIAVRYYTRSGNTKKLADAVALTASVESKDITCPLTEKADTIGVAVADEEFHCRGEFAKIHKGRPDENDIAKVSEFTKSIIKK